MHAVHVLSDLSVAFGLLKSSIFIFLMTIGHHLFNLNHSVNVKWIRWYNQMLSSQTYNPDFVQVLARTSNNLSIYTNLNGKNLIHQIVNVPLFLVTRDNFINSDKILKRFSIILQTSSAFVHSCQQLWWTHVCQVGGSTLCWTWN